MDIRNAQYLKNKDILYDNQNKIIRNVACRKFSDAGIIANSYIRYNIVYEKMKCMYFDIGVKPNLILGEIDTLVNKYKRGDYDN